MNTETTFEMPPPGKASLAPPITPEERAKLESVRQYILELEKQIQDSTPGARRERLNQARTAHAANPTPETLAALNVAIEQRGDPHSRLEGLKEGEIKRGRRKLMWSYFNEARPILSDLYRRAIALVDSLISEQTAREAEWLKDVDAQFATWSHFCGIAWNKPAGLTLTRGWIARRATLIDGLSRLERASAADSSEPPDLRSFLAELHVAESLPTAPEIVHRAPPYGFRFPTHAAPAEVWPDAALPEPAPAPAKPADIPWHADALAPAPAPAEIAAEGIHVHALPGNEEPAEESEEEEGGPSLD